ncbi:MAG: universal stress protein UspA, partial [Pseudarthrobacter sp.]|nr:universal stress protein UspA [Pseudarthrobacter sp.]
MDTESKVVVGVDGSDSSIEALRLAARLAPALDARVHAVACWDFPQMYAGYVPPDF